jgi:hypothetical protein
MEQATMEVFSEEMRAEMKAHREEMMAGLK